GVARLEEAVASYREAIKERTRERVPLDWAVTQSNLGLALKELGEQTGSATQLEEAAAACRAALSELTRERTPIQWARTLNTLGLVLRTIGSNESGTTSLNDAIVYFRSALDELSQSDDEYLTNIVRTNLKLIESELPEKRWYEG